MYAKYTPHGMLSIILYGCKTNLLNKIGPRYRPNFRNIVTSLYKSNANPVVPNYRSIINRWNDIAIEDKNGTYSYGQIYSKSLYLQSMLQSIVGQKQQQNVAFLLGNDISYVVTQWATWGAGHVAVPLHPNYPDVQLQYCIENSEAALIITTEEYASKLKTTLSGQQVLVLKNTLMQSTDAESELRKSKQAAETALKCIKKDENLEDSSHALIIYTSGTTGPPKGVVLTHKNLHAQVQNILHFWGISSSDVHLHCLPLNHMHGIVNALVCPLYCGARVIMEPEFKASAVWSHLLNLNNSVSSRVNVFMAVPTIYAKLIEEYDKKFARNQRMTEYIRSVCQENIRLMISGSASLPTTIFEKWRSITGHTLLERYGMTEIGMALSNPLNGPRIPGAVGNPLPGVKVQICQFSPNRDSVTVLCEGTNKETVVTPGYAGEPGELLVKGDNVFSHYWKNEEATKREFTSDGWFCTGDTAAYIDGCYRILGRTSVDIIKSGGFKISALDIERELLKHPNISEIAVVGLPDITWGEKVAALLVWNGSSSFNLQEFRNWAKDVLPPYQVPTVVKIVADQLPKNNMGKVNKKQLIKEFFPQS